MYKVCIFDLDGTLTDTVESLTYSVNATLSELCSGKTSIEKCSGETLYKIAKVLNVSMESLLSDDSYERGFKRELEEEKER